jgi:hypothetical protein
VITVPAKLWHVMDVLANLSAQNVSELDQLGLSNWETFKRINQFMQTGEATTLLLEDHRPCCVFGVTWEPSDYHRTWFIATERYWQLGMAGVRHARRFLKDAARRGPLITGSCSPHPEVERWFKLLGYEKLEETEGVKWFKYG